MSRSILPTGLAAVSKVFIEDLLPAVFEYHKSDKYLPHGRNSRKNLRGIYKWTLMHSGFDGLTASVGNFTF